MTLLIAILILGILIGLLICLPFYLKEKKRTTLTEEAFKGLLSTYQTIKEREKEYLVTLVNAEKSNKELEERSYDPFPHKKSK